MAKQLKVCPTGDEKDTFIRSCYYIYRRQMGISRSAFAGRCLREKEWRENIIEEARADRAVR